MNNQPLISVIIPTYNSERYLSSAIESVLNQTYLNYELLVVDDGSTDSSTQIAQSFANHIHYLYKPWSGIYLTRDYGVKASASEWIAFLDADDLWLENKLSLQMQAVIDNPQIDMFFTHVEEFYEDNAPSDIRRLHTAVAGVIPSTLLIRRSAWNSIVMNTTNQQTGEFVEWYAKALEAGLSTLILPQTLAKRRVHANNISVQQRNQKNQQLLHTLKASLDRRRAKAK